MISFCLSHDWDRYCEQYTEFLGCPVCNSPSDDTWIEVEENDPKFKELNERLRCKDCGVYFDFAMEYFDKFRKMWTEEEPEYDDCQKPSEDELKEGENYKSRGNLGFLWTDKKGNPTTFGRNVSN